MPELAPVRTHTQVALFGLTIGVAQAVLNPIFDDVRHSLVNSQRSRDQVWNGRIGLGRRGRQPRDVLVPVAAGQQEIWVDDDQRSPVLDAQAERRGNRRFSQLHVGWFNDRVIRITLERGHHLQQHRVTLRAPRTVVDQDDAGGFG